MAETSSFPNGRSLAGYSTINSVDLGGVLARLDPLQQTAVDLVYFRGLSPTDAARQLAVDPGTVIAALAGTFRQLADWVLGEDGAPESLLVGEPVAS